MPRTSSRKGSVTLGGLILTLLVAAVLYYLDSHNTNPASLPAASPTENSAAVQNPPANALDWLQVYFTNPNPPDSVDSGIDQYVVADVNKARTSIDVTSFDLNLPSFVNALVAAEQRGVTVRVVADEVNGSQTLAASFSGTGQNFDALQVFKSAKIPVVNGGRSSGLMHDKIIIIDGNILYMGSWNMSYNDTFRNNNNLLRITNPTLIANYQAKFDELVAGGHFGTHATVGAQTPQLTINGVKVENYFSPVDQVMDKLVAYVQGAQKSVRFFIFTYTDANLSQAMIDDFNRGVDVQGVIEDRGASQGAMVPLFCAKVPTKVDGNKYTMHHKVIVIDESTVITGSFNFTKSADDENDDNVLVIHNADLARLYLQEFDRVSAIAKVPANVTCK